jgi:hypothetical protein
LQIVDFCAYALLCQECPTGKRVWYENHKAFGLLDPILVKAANGDDPQGIIRT